MHRKLKDKNYYAFIYYIFKFRQFAVCLFACNHHSSNPMLQQVDSLLEMKPDSALTILKNIICFRGFAGSRQGILCFVAG
mgnify:CR=1 FL=1